MAQTSGSCSSEIVPSAMRVGDKEVYSTLLLLFSSFCWVSVLYLFSFLLSCSLFIVYDERMLKGGYLF